MFESSVTSPTSVFGNLSKDSGLFLLFNLMILFILISSIFNTHKDHQNHQNRQDVKSILQRLLSLNFYSNFKPQEENHYRYPQSHYNDPHEIQHETHLPNSHTNQPNTNFGNFEQNYVYNFHQTQEKGRSNIMEDEHEEGVGDEPTLDEIYSQIRNNKKINHFRTINPNSQKPEGHRPSFNDEVPVHRLRKTASMTVPCSSSRFEDRDGIENRRPMTMRERRRTGMIEVDEGVDERATDFINRFKQQLRLQRMESIKKCKDI